MYRSGAYWINDHASKFGTLMMMRENFAITSNMSLSSSYQIGKCVLEFFVKKVEVKCFGICGG